MRRCGHRKCQAAERLIADEDWHDNGLVFCHPDGRQYTREGHLSERAQHRDG